MLKDDSSNNDYSLNNEYGKGGLNMTIIQEIYIQFSIADMNRNQKGDDVVTTSSPVF